MISSNEIEARNVSFLLEIKYNESFVVFKAAKKEVHYLVQDRV